MQRASLYGAAATVVLSLVVTTLKVTARPIAPACPRCGARNATIVAHPEATEYHCSCQHCWTGSPVSGFSWLQAVEHWLTDWGVDERRLHSRSADKGG